MKIALNMHFFSKRYYPIFLSLIKSISKINFEDEIFIYSQFDNCDFFNENINFVNTSKFLGFYGYNILFGRELKRQKFDIFINFDDIYPIFSVKNIFSVVFFLENIMYFDKKYLNFFNKYIYLFNLKFSLKNTNTFFCFTEKSKIEINEKLNIKEEKIKVLRPFFFSNLKSQQNHKDVFLTHGISGDYFIYDAGIGNNKNLDRLLLSFKKVSEDKNIFLLCLGKEISEDLYFRRKVLENNLQEKIIFTQDIEDKDLEIYYKNSIGVIYPVLYEVFPFYLSNRVNNNVPILASNIQQIKDIFGDTITYFNPTFLDDMVYVINNFLKKPRQKVNYDFKNYYKPIYFLNDLFKNLNININ